MRRLVPVCAVLLAVAAGAHADPPLQAFDRSNARGNQLVVRAAAADVPAIAAQYGLAVASEVTVGNGHLALLEGPELMTAQQIEDLISGDPRIESHERIQLATLPGSSGSAAVPDPGETAADVQLAGSLSTPCLGQHFQTPLWSGYADQQAVRRIRLHEAHLEPVGCGAAVVAVLDTGVDPDHPALAGALTTGYDFLRNRAAIPSEWDFLDGTVQPILEGTVQPILETELDGTVQPILEGTVQPILESLATDEVAAGEGDAVMLGPSIAPVVEPSAAATLEGLGLPAFFGHGTMVAGLVRLSAPGALIMPIRVFDAEGTAHLYDILNAIYYAVDQGADVINMSFSIGSSSNELKQAVQYARSRGVVCVAAAGNRGERTLVYPAAYSGAAGVAATDAADRLSPYSNYGPALVDLAAPGSGVVSTYPGGLFAAGWGTSFSAPFVAGAAALVHTLHPGGDGATFQGVMNDLSQGSVRLPDLSGDAGSGRLDVLGAVLAAD